MSALTYQIAISPSALKGKLLVDWRPLRAWYSG